MKQAHFILQPKDGTGKSVVATMLAQFYYHNDAVPQCIDLDQYSQTFAQYEALKVKVIDILEDNTFKLDIKSFDTLIESICEYSGVSVIDTSSSIFLPFMQYAMESDAFGLLKANGVEVFVHSVVSGGDMTFDTLVGFNDIARSVDVPMIAWINGHSGPLPECDFIVENGTKIIGTVVLEHLEPGFEKTLSILIGNRLTYLESQQSAYFKIAEKKRIKIIFEGVFDQLEKVVIADTQEI